MEREMNVGELRAALTGVPDHLPVYVSPSSGPMSGGQVGAARQARVRQRTERGVNGATRSDLWWMGAPDEALVIDGYTEEHRDPAPPAAEFELAPWVEMDTMWGRPGEGSRMAAWLRRRWERQ